MKIDKITPQIAALYLGQKCDVKWNPGCDISSIYERDFCGETRIEYYTAAWIAAKELDITPHLRLLESLTEDEVMELKGICGYEGDDRSMVFANSGLFFEIGSPAVWLKLLEWGIDLFGLIDAGLAKEIKPT